VLLLTSIDVVLNGLAGCGADGAVEVAAAPEGLAPELVADPVPALPANPPGAGPLQAPDYLSHAVILIGPHEEMDVVGPKLQGVDQEAEALRCPVEALLADLLDRLVPEDVTPVLERELEVEVGLADAMVTPYQFHTITSSPACRLHLEPRRVSREISLLQFIFWLKPEGFLPRVN